MYSEISYTSDDGLRLYARDYPAASGPARLPVICIHGLTRAAGVATISQRVPATSSVCWVSDRPSSHGVPACLTEDSGEAPVPPSWPATTMWSALAFDTPA